MAQTKRYRKLPLADQGDRIINLAVDSACIFGFAIVHVLVLDVWLGIGPLTVLPLDLLIFQFVFYTLFETFTGKTPGKYVTKTEVVLIDGSRPGFFTILGRSLTRIMFIDTLSFLLNKRGWHDYFSNTYVISKKQKSNNYNANIGSINS